MITHLDSLEIPRLQEQFTLCGILINPVLLDNENPTFLPLTSGHQSIHAGRFDPNESPEHITFCEVCVSICLLQRMK